MKPLLSVHFEIGRKKCEPLRVETREQACKLIAKLYVTARKLKPGEHAAAYLHTWLETNGKPESYNAEYIPPTQ